MKLAGIPSQIMSYPQEVRIEKLTWISYRGFTMFQMNTTTLINTLRAPLSKVRNKRKSIKHEAAGIPSQIMSYPQEVRIEKLTGLATLGFEPRSSRIHVWTRNVPDELLRIYDNMNA
ncbi:unnamed protein product [Sphenostylis stenocarpa]|uniref:Uncharacterized protein n=1 Tax=Sphenostylis stenocarpa TaxID=92480 RepID=A0AA86VXA6_9FABA|nr:unnamed protein product [Sphenostylis stenocarpa]